MIWLKALQKRLITRFSVEQRLISAEQLQSLSRLSFIPQILVGRDYCQYACINLSNVPRAKREQALKHQIDALSLWSDTAYSVAWYQGDAQVWLWDKDAISRLINGIGLAEWGGLYKPTFLSEILYWSKPLEPGLQLFKSHHGYDLQYWQSGLLRASQWYLHEPNEQQVQRFSRSQGLTLSATKLAVNKPHYTNEPWSGVVVSLWEHFFERRSQIVIGLAALSILIASLQLTAVARWYWEEHKLEQQTAILAQSANALLTARSEARAASIEIGKLEQLLVVPDPLGTQQKIYQHLPANTKLKLQIWERNIDQVDMTVQGEIPDTLSMVRAFEQDGMKNVRVEPTAEANKYRIRLKLDGFAQNNEGRK
jgi:hypothetical protein